MTPLEVLSDDASSPSEASGGASESSPGSSSSTVTSGATDLSIGAQLSLARAKAQMSRYQLDKQAKLGSGGTKKIEEGARVPDSIALRRIEEALGMDPNSLQQAIVPQEPRGTSHQGERRPSSDGKSHRRSILGGRKPRTESGGSSTSSPTRPAVRRVTTSPLSEWVITFASGGLARIGQGPLAMFASFTAPVAGEIVDDVVAGTMVDKVVQPLVRGSEKYQNLGALFAGYASIAWATNVPEAADQAYGLFRWSMMTLLPLQGKEMAKRAREQRKAMEAMAEIEPELVEMFGPDPIRGLWTTIWAQRAPEPVPEEEPAPA